MTGVSYVRPDRRPTCRTTDVLDPSLPADLRASGRIARVNKRKAFWSLPLMPPHSQKVRAGSRAEGPTAAKTLCTGRELHFPAVVREPSRRLSGRRGGVTPDEGTSVTDVMSSQEQVRVLAGLTAAGTLLA